MENEIEKELKQLADLVKEIIADKSHDPLVILRDFTAVDWNDWLEDIMNYGIAYPISEVSSDGDVIVDMVKYLRENTISTHNYEIGIATIIEQFAFSNSNTFFLERLINALISLRGQKTHATLLRILISRDNNYLKGKYDNIKSIALLALARSSGLDEITKQTAYNYIIMVGLKEMKHDPSFYGNVLRFSYLQFSVNNFFNDFGIVLIILNRISHEKYSEEYTDRYINVLVDKIEEVHFRRIATFYSSFCKWLIANASFWLENKLFVAISDKFCDMLNDGPVVYEINDCTYSQPEFTEYEYGKCLRFILNLTKERLVRGASLSDAIKISAFLLDKEDSIKSLEYILKKHQIFISEHYGILPYIARTELKSIYDMKIIQRVIDLYDTAIFLPDEGDDNLQQAELNSNTKAKVLARNTKNFIGLLEKNEKVIFEALDKQYAEAY